MHSVFAAPSGLAFFPLLSPLPLRLDGGSPLLDPVTVASFLSRSYGCSPNSAPSPGAAYAGSVVDQDPPLSLPPRPCVCSTHLIFMCSIRILFLAFLLNAFSLRSFLLFSFLLFSRPFSFPLLSRASPAPLPLPYARLALLRSPFLFTALL